MELIEKIHKVVEWGREVGRKDYPIICVGDGDEDWLTFEDFEEIERRLNAVQPIKELEAWVCGYCGYKHLKPYNGMTCQCGAKLIIGSFQVKV